MPQQFFSGTCSENELISFSFLVAGVTSFYGMPEEMLVLPISKKRRTYHQAFGRCENKKGSVLLEPKRTKLIHSLLLGFYPIKDVNHVIWESNSGNEIVFYRTKDDKFFFILRERTLESGYRRILESGQVELVRGRKTIEKIEFA